MKHGLTLLLSMTIGSVAQLPALAGTLDKIRSSNEISIGFRQTAVPFSYNDGNQKPVGYSIEMCQAVVSGLKDQLNLPGLRTTYAPVEASSRIPLIANGTVDIECGTTSNTIERHSQVAFSLTTFVAATKFASKKLDTVETIGDLKGKPVAATAGSSNLRQVTELNRTQSLDMRIISAKDFAEGFLMLETGRVSAFFLDDVSLAAFIAASKNPNDYKISSQAFSVEPYAIMMRNDDPTFKEAVDKVLRELLTSERSRSIYSKWFEQPIPPKGIVLKLPMGDAVRKAFARPTDSADPGSY
jgi:glutamate/aspartate transport system substrate-binding protein